MIAIRQGKHRMLAVARGALKNSADTISLDQRSREKLGVKPRETAAFIFQFATSVDQFLWAWHATDAMPRIAARLGILSVILGGVGLLLGAFFTVADATQLKYG